MEKTFKVALRTGGLMENPEIRYEDVQIIKAETQKEAEKIYDTNNNCCFYHGSAIAVLNDKTNRWNKIRKNY